MNKLPEDPIKYLRLADFSGGRNTTITPALLNANESPTAKRMSFDQKGTIRPGWGRVSRYDEPFSDQPVSGLAEYRKNDGRTWLMIGAGDKIYYDRPSMTWKWEGDALPDDMLQPLDDPTFTRSSVAYKTDGTQVSANVPRFEDGKFGKAIMVEEGTTNLLSAENSSFEGGTVGNWGATLSTLSIVSSPSWHGGKALKIVPTAQDGRAQIRVDSGGLGLISQGDTVTLSAYARLESGGPANVTVAFIIGGVGGFKTTLPVTSSGWTRISITKTIDQLGTSVYIQLYGGEYGVSQATVIFDGIKLEKKAYPTSWTLGGTTRSPETLTIPTAGVLNPQEGTIKFWWCPINQPASTMTGSQFVAPPIIQVGNYHQNNSWILWCGMGSQLKLFVRGDNATGWTGQWTIIPNLSWYQLNRWYRIVVRWENANTFWIFIDGVKYGPYVSSQPFTGIAGNIMSLGRLNASSGPSNAYIDDLRISNIARSDAEIAEAYASGEPLSVDPYTTYLMNFDGDLSHREAYGWNSPVVNVGTAKDKASGYASVEIESGSVSVFSRSAPADNGPWTDWVPVASDGKLLHEADNFVQLRLATFATGVVVKSITVIFDASPNATLLKDELTPNSIYCFKTFRNTLLIANGNDPLQKWDGEAETTSDVEGEPPAFALIEVHQNRLWGIKDNIFPSRLRFTDLLNYESWPALNFIDVSPDDGDVPTALRSNGTYLMIHKSKRTAVLVGDQTENYNITWLEAESGAQGQWAVAQTDRYLSYVAQDGIRFSDLTTSVNAIERLLPDWENINRRLLYKSAQAYWGHLLLTSLPGTGAVTGNTETWVYDAMRNAWTLRDDWAFSCFTKFNEYGSDVLLAGDATTGQVYKITPEPIHDGVPVEYEWKSKELNFNEPERYKVWSTVYILVEGEKTQRTLQVRFYVDGDLKGGPDLVIPAGEGVVHTVRLFPSQYNAIFGQRLAISLKGSNGVHLITIGYTLRTFALGVL